MTFTPCAILSRFALLFRLLPLGLIFLFGLLLLLAPILLLRGFVSSKRIRCQNMVTIYLFLFSHGRDFWRVKIQPRRLLLSRIIHNVIHVFSVLRRHHLPVQGGCLFCDHEDETMDHVLLHCPYAKAIWFASRFGFLVNCGRFPSVRSWILYWCNRWRRDEAFVQDVWISVICTLNALWFFRNSCRWGRSRVQPSVSQVNRLSLRFSYDSDFSASAEPILQLGSTSLG